MPLYLSKSKYCLGVQCPKMLWLHRHKAAEFDDSCIDEGAMETGNEVGDLAKNLFGSYEEVPYSQHHQDMLDMTKKLIEQGAPVIAEATFARAVSSASAARARTSLSSGYLEKSRGECGRVI